MIIIMINKIMNQGKLSFATTLVVVRSSITTLGEVFVIIMLNLNQEQKEDGMEGRKKEKDNMVPSLKL